MGSTISVHFDFTSPFSSKSKISFRNHVYLLEGPFLCGDIVHPKSSKLVWNANIRFHVSCAWIIQSARLILNKVFFVCVIIYSTIRINLGDHVIFFVTVFINNSDKIQDILCNKSSILLDWIDLKIRPNEFKMFVSSLIHLRTLKTVLL